MLSRPYNKQAFGDSGEEELPLRTKPPTAGSGPEDQYLIMYND